MNHLVAPDNLIEDMKDENDTYVPNHFEEYLKRAYQSHPFYENLCDFHYKKEAEGKTWDYYREQQACSFIRYLWTVGPYAGLLEADTVNTEILNDMGYSEEDEQFDTMDLMRRMSSI